MTTEERKHLYRKGKYIYFRNPRSGKLTPLPKDETSQEFADAYDALVGSPALITNGAIKPDADGIIARRPQDFKPGSIGWFIERYCASEEFLNLADNTRKSYRICCDQVTEECGVAMLHDLTPKGVNLYSQKMRSHYSASIADVHTTILSNLWKFAGDFEEFQPGDRLCPTIGRTRRYKKGGDGHLAWPDEVIDKFDAWAEPHLRRYRMALQYTGQRGCDVVTMKWDDYDGEQIHVVQQKTGERLWLHCPDVLKGMLDGMERISDHIFTHSWGRPYTSADSLSNCIKLHLKKIGFPDYVMHGLRKNAGMELALAGCTVPEIMSVLGHRSPKMAMFYVQQADKRRLSKAASAKLNAYVAEKEAAKSAKKAAKVAERRANIREV